jgi:hypothetical protein
MIAVWIVGAQLRPASSLHPALPASVA